MTGHRPAAAGARVAVQGDPGCFSHAAAVGAFGEVQLVPCADFPVLFDAVESGRADRGVVPVENALAGAVTENLDLLLRRDLRAVAEAYVRVELCLAVRPSSGGDDQIVAGLDSAASHPVALRQCRRFFSDHRHIRPMVAADTAGSIRELMEGGAAWSAAIGPALAADLYGARIVARGIEDDPRNFTRFLVVARRGEGDGLPPPDPSTRTGRAKASLVFTLAHRPGSLHRAIGLLAQRGLDLTRLESRPIVGRPWEYAFHADVRGADEDRVRGGIRALRDVASEVTEIGVYPEERVPGE